MSSPGLHDPYWYEDTLAELFAVEMLDPSSEIESVTLQEPGLFGVDDIVVRYRDRKVACYQVKHTRSDDNLTFADLLKSKDRGPSLLRQFVAGWQQQPQAVVACETHLYTNRAAGERATNSAPDALYRYPLLSRWVWTKDALLEIEHFVGRDTREHADLQIEPFRSDSRDTSSLSTATA